MSKSLVHSILWSFTGDAKMKVRDAMGDFIRSATTIPLPPNVNVPILDFEVSISGKEIIEKISNFIHNRYNDI